MNPNLVAQRGNADDSYIQCSFEVVQKSSWGLLQCSRESLKTMGGHLWGWGSFSQRHKIEGIMKRSWAMEPCSRVRVSGEAIDEIAISVADANILEMSDLWNDHQRQQRVCVGLPDPTNCIYLMVELERWGESSPPNQIWRPNDY